jgi:chromosome segregation ATPase
VNLLEYRIARYHGRRGGTMKDDPTSAVLTALGALKAGQQQHAAALEQLRSDLTNRMDRLDNAITAIRDDITVTMRLADRAQEAADHTRARLSALGDRVTAMMHQIQDLQAEVRNLKGEGPRTEQAGAVSHGFGR